ncbi:MAG: methyltransferase domain-containing protein [Dehalococcoidia bacterium]|nr:methyltransferase domain-containing protein [Dehalococcoidia bacterium]
MGPHPLWLAEWLCEAMALQPGMRVLDFGCGTALTSVFLAREFGVQVWAADLWIAPTENLARIEAAGVADRVFPLRAEAHALPFAHGFFDAAISIDAYHYFGTDDLYLSYFAPFLRPGARFGIAVPGLVNAFESVPAHLEPYWEPDFWTFHTAAWWQRHLERSGQLTAVHADDLDRGWEDWARWLEFCATHGARTSERELEMVRTDASRNLTFVRCTATRRPGAAGVVAEHRLRGPQDHAPR